jgi:hypothetical protein
VEEFAAARVVVQVLGDLERRRPEIVGDEAKVRAAVDEALVPVRAAYEEQQLPPAYLTALEKVVRETVPEAWHRIARPFTAAENHGFFLWRRGDPVARITCVFIGLVVGGLCVWLPFIPIWEKWFPFVLAFGAWWLPTAQVAWYKRRYARQLGDIATRVGKAQPQLEGTIRTEELLLPPKGDTGLR